MSKEGQGALGAAAVTAGLALLVFQLVQTHEVEKRLVVQGQQIRALGEAVERLSAAGGDRAARPAEVEPKAAEDPIPEHVLHPEVPNFLKPKSRHWPTKGQFTEGALIRGWPSGDPKGFNPIIENSEDIVDIIGPLCGASLAYRDPWTDPNDWNGDLATRVEITDDMKEFTFYLRKGVKWHEPLGVSDPRHAWMKGDHFLTAEDVVFTLDLIMNPQVSNGFIKNYFKELESWKAVDEHTVVVRWKKKEYLNVETTLSISPVPKFLLGSDEDGKPFPKETLGLRVNQHWYNNKGFVGAGPYRMTSYEPGNSIVLRRNDDYHGDKPSIRDVRFVIFTDPNQTLLKLKAHEIGIGGLTPGQYRDEILQYQDAKTKPAGSPFFDGRIQHDFISRFSYYYVGWNADRPLFSDKRVRRAMTLAMNRKQILDSVFVGLGKLATGPYMAESPANDPSIQPIPFDLEQAKKELAEAGWTDTDGDGIVDGLLHPGDTKRTPFQFTLLIYGSSKEYAAFANIYKEDLLKIGVKMNIDAAEWSLMQKRMHEKDFDAYTGGWGLTWEEDLYQIWHSSQADVPQGSNRVGFRNAAADRIIEKLRVTFDRDERLALLREFHRLVNDEQPYTFMLSRTIPFCHWNDVTDVVYAKYSPPVLTFPWAVARTAN
ncbi:MAG TPA: ABC transporter substrate-binding protein [Polyangiaceae bacterium]|nr:ABC transporter substrate-binding protein [Polyangiaceae bacterium]